MTGLTVTELHTQDGYDWPAGCTDERWPADKHQPAAPYFREQVWSPEYLAAINEPAHDIGLLKPSVRGRARDCWCHTCRPVASFPPEDMRLVLCPDCGNKRCPKANNHCNACTGSNAPGQPGSAY